MVLIMGIWREEREVVVVGVGVVIVGGFSFVIVGSSGE